MLLNMLCVRAFMWQLHKSKMRAKLTALRNVERALLTAWNNNDGKQVFDQCAGNNK